jgi:hypothetical protein
MRRRLEEAILGSTFDIFRLLPDGPLWITAVDGITEAKERMARLVLITPGEYFIYSQENGVVAKQSQEERADCI